MSIGAFSWKKIYNETHSCCNNDESKLKSRHYHVRGANIFGRNDVGSVLAPIKQYCMRDLPNINEGQVKYKGIVQC